MAQQEFKVVIDGEPLADNHSASLADALKQTTLAHLADIDTGGDQSAIRWSPLPQPINGLVATRPTPIEVAATPGRPPAPPSHPD